MKPVNPNGNQSWISIGRTDAEAETPVLRPSNAKKIDSFKKILMLGKIEVGRRRGWQRMRWHHWLDGHEFGWTPGAGDGQGGLACCKPWGRKESDSNKQLNWTDEDKSCSLPEGSQVDSKKQRQEPNKNQETGPRKILDLSPFIYALQPTLAKR